MHLPSRYLQELEVGEEGGVEQAITAAPGERADADVLEGLFVDQQPGFKHLVIHDMRIIVEAAEFEVSEYGGPLKKVICSFRSFLIVGYAEGCERGGAVFL